MSSKIFTLVCAIVRVTWQTVQIYSSDILKSLNSRQEKQPLAEECLQSPQSFEENKSTGNYGLTVEFYKTLWGILGKLHVLVESLNCA